LEVDYSKIVYNIKHEMGLDKIINSTISDFKNQPKKNICGWIFPKMIEGDKNFVEICVAYHVLAIISKTCSWVTVDKKKV
jgi:hypothetical protein